MSGFIVCTIIEKILNRSEMMSSRGVLTVDERYLLLCGFRENLKIKQAERRNVENKKMSKKCPRDRPNSLTNVNFFTF